MEGSAAADTMTTSHHTQGGGGAPQQYMQQMHQQGGVTFVPLSAEGLAGAGVGDGTFPQGVMLTAENLSQLGLPGASLVHAPDGYSTSYSGGYGAPLDPHSAAMMGYSSTAAYDPATMAMLQQYADSFSNMNYAQQAQSYQAQIDASNAAASMHSGYAPYGGTSYPVMDPAYAYDPHYLSKMMSYAVPSDGSVPMLYDPSSITLVDPSSLPYGTMMAPSSEMPTSYQHPTYSDATTASQALSSGSIVSIGNPIGSGMNYSGYMPHSNYYMPSAPIPNGSAARGAGMTLPPPVAQQPAKQSSASTTDYKAYDTAASSNPSDAAETLPPGYGADEAEETGGRRSRRKAAIAGSKRTAMMAAGTLQDDIWDMEAPVKRKSAKGRTLTTSNKYARTDDPASAATTESSAPHIIGFDQATGLPIYSAAVDDIEDADAIEAEDSRSSKLPAPASQGYMSHTRDHMRATNVTASALPRIQSVPGMSHAVVEDSCTAVFSHTPYAHAGYCSYLDLYSKLQRFINNAMRPGERYRCFPRLPCLLWTDPGLLVGEFMIISNEFPSFFLVWYVRALLCD